MIVEAMCVADAFDNGVKGVAEPRRYFRGPVPDFDTENTRLTALTTNRGEWVFQYPGHTGFSQEWLAQNTKQTPKAAEVPVEVQAPPKKTTPKRTMSEAHKKKMKEAREAARARKAEKAAA